MKADVTGLMAQPRKGWEKRVGLMEDIPMALDYLAGLIDGEGTVGVFKSTVGSRASYHAEVSVSNTNRALLSKVQQRFGGRVRQSGGGCYLRDKLRWNMTYDEMRKLLPLLIPLLILKRDNARVVLEFLAGMISPSQKKRRVSPAELRRREALYQITKALNSQRSVASVGNGYVVCIRALDTAWNSLTSVEQQRLLGKLRLVGSAATGLAAGMEKGTRKYSTDSYSVEQWMAHVLGEGYDQLNYQILLANAFEKKQSDTPQKRGRRR